MTTFEPKPGDPIEPKPPVTPGEPLIQDPVSEQGDRDGA